VVEVKEVKSVTFGGATTDFDLEPNLQYVDDLVLEKPGKGVIKWTQNNIDVGGADFDSHVKFGKGSVSVDSANLNWELNSSANITLYDLEFAYTPAVYADGKVCTDCIIISYENGDFTFNVPHFTNYSAGVNTNLTIYDEYEGSFVYNGTNITFFANYTNITDGSHISGADCNISFDDDTSAMMTEAGSNYNYTKEGGFSTPGLHNWNVTCNVTNFETLNATDDVNVTTYCNGNYYGGNWIVNSSVYCSDEVIPVNGALTLRDDSETAVTQFSTIRGAAYDLSGNDAVITAAIPDLDKTTPAQYTSDWDSNANHEFYIVMDESEHIIQIFTNNSDSQSKYYAIDMDGSKSSGGTVNGFTGSDFALGYYGGVIIGCYNETAGDNTFFDLSAGEGSTTCGDVAGWDSNYNGNFTVYWKNYSNAIEVIINVSGSWVDKETYAGDVSNSYYTRFQNSTVVEVNALGNLTLNNITLNIEGNLDVYTIFTVENSTIKFQLTDNGTANMTFYAGSVININSSTLTSNDTSYHWDWQVSTGDYNITNNNISFSIENQFESNTGGLIYNNTFSNTTFRDIKIENYNSTGMNISSNTFLDPLEINVYLDGYGSGITIENNIIYGGLTLRSETVTNNNITGNIFPGGGLWFIEGTTGNILKNNNFSLSNYISDHNLTGTNTMIYSNQHGEIKWQDKNNLSIETDLYFNDSVFIEFNKLGLANDVNLANLNTSAQLTFYGLNDTSHHIYKDGVRCDNSSACNIIYNSGGTVIAEVSSFSNYTTQEFLVNCGDTIDTFTTLDGNLTTCNSTGLTIGAHNIVLDCGGYTISGNGSNPIYNAGLVSYGWDNLTIRNCSIKQFRVAMSLAHGSGFLIDYNHIENLSGDPDENDQMVAISIENFSNSEIRHNNISDIIFETNRVKALKAINLDNGDNISIWDNRIYNLKCQNNCSDLKGIDWDIINNSRIYSNFIYNLSGNGSSFSASGIEISNSSESIVYNNYVHNINGTFFTSGIGVDSEGPSNDLNISGNNVSTNDVGLGGGIWCGMIENSSISGNRIWNNSYGLYLGYAPMNWAPVNLQVVDNNIFNNSLGLGMEGASNISFSGNIYSGNDEDISVKNSSTDINFQSSLSYVSLFVDNTSNVTFSNLTLGNSTTSKVNFIDLNVSELEINTTRDFSFDTNFLAINGTASPGLNVSANITFVDVTYADNDSFRVLKDGAVCNSPDCLKLGFSPVLFQVSEFSNYTTQQIFGCGYINSDATLIQNVSSTGTCFTINASDIVLDCAGHNVNYSTAGTLGYGVDNTGGHDNVTIRNCNIYEGSTTTSSKYAVYFSSADNGTFENNNITTIGSSGHGIYFLSVNNMTVNNTKIITSGSSAEGIHLNTCDGNVFVGVNVSANSGTAFYIEGSSALNNFSDGQLVSNSQRGVWLQGNDADNNIFEHSFIEAGGSSSSSVRIYAGDGNQFLYNTINQTNTAGWSAIYLLSSADDTFIVGNNVSSVKTTFDEDYGALLHISGSSRANVSYNSFDDSDQVSFYVGGQCIITIVSVIIQVMVLLWDILGRMI
jgi:hypothetical protein